MSSSQPLNLNLTPAPSVGQISRYVVLQTEIHPFVTPAHITTGFSRNWFQDNHMKEVEVLLEPILAQYDQYSHNARKEKKHHGCIAGTDLRLGYAFRPKREKQILLTKLSTRSRTAAAAPYRHASIQGLKLVVYVCPRQHSLSAQTSVAFSQLLNDKSIADQAAISSYFQPVSHDNEHKTKISSSPHNKKETNIKFSFSSIRATEIKNCTQELDLAFATAKSRNDTCLRKSGRDSALTAVQLRSNYQGADNHFSYIESGEGHVASNNMPKSSLENVVEDLEESRKSSKTHKSTTANSLNVKEHKPEVQPELSCANDCAKEIKTVEIELGIMSRSGDSKSSVAPLSASKTISFTKDSTDTKVSKTKRLTRGDRESHIFVSSQLCRSSLGKKCTGKTKRGMHLKIKEFYSKQKVKNNLKSHQHSLRVKKSIKCLSVSNKSVQHGNHREPQCSRDIISGNVSSCDVKDELPDLMDSTALHQPPSAAASHQSPVIISLSSGVDKLQSPLEQSSVCGGPPQSCRTHLVTDSSSERSCPSSRSPKDQRNERDSVHASVEGTGDFKTEWKGKDTCHESKSHKLLCLKRPVEESEKGYECKRQRAFSSESCSLQNVFRSTDSSSTTAIKSEKEGCLSIPDMELERCVLRLEADLKALKQGDHYSRRHKQYMEGGRCRRLLDGQIHLEYFKEGQEDIVMDTLLTMFPETDHQSLDYIMRVLLPETLMRVYQEVTGHSVEDP